MIVIFFSSIFFGLEFQSCLGSSNWTWSLFYSEGEIILKHLWFRKKCFDKLIKKENSENRMINRMFLFLIKKIFLFICDWYILSQYFVLLKHQK